MRLLILRALFSHDRGSGIIGAPYEVLDYDIAKFEQKTVGYLPSGGAADKNADYLDERDDFFFNTRPDWVDTRW